LLRLGLGLAALGRPAYINVGRSELPPSRSVADMRAASWAVLDAAYDAGVRWVDVARSYGLAEEFLAGWLSARAPTDVTVSSKWGYAYVGGWRMDAAVHEEKSHTLDRFRTQWAESTALLGSRLALYQVHSLTPDSPLFDDLVPLRGVRAQLLISRDALTAGDITKARTFFNNFKNGFTPNVQNLISVRSASALQETKDARQAASVKFADSNATAADLTPLVVMSVGLLCGSLTGAVFGFFVTMPYSKFVHGIYRYAALVRYARERNAFHGPSPSAKRALADPDPTPAR